MPIPVNSGTVLEGYSSSASASPKWWEEDCRVLSTSHTTQYNPNFLKSMFMFTLEPGAAIQNLRLRGASCNFQDYNGDQKLCGGIFVGDDWGTSEALIANCEISCFSYAGFSRPPNLDAVVLENCYVHKVKANGNAPNRIWMLGRVDLMIHIRKETFPMKM
ncbi:MAG: hypothetical protein IPP34_12740 [Bacteroidetes bacterium]|nr:hypothetical protein [Bacteroidota bacterium]